MVHQMQDVINQINIPKDKKQLIVSTDTEKVFYKIQQVFVIKENTGIEKNISQHSNSYIWETHSQHPPKWRKNLNQSH